MSMYLFYRQIYKGNNNIVCLKKTYTLQIIYVIYILYNKISLINENKH